MAVLGVKKAILLKRVKDKQKRDTISFTEFKKLLDTYEDLTIADLAIVLAPEVVKDLEDRLCAPQEKQIIEVTERVEVEKNREHTKWTALNRKSYTSLQHYKTEFPDSVHKEELDDLMWALTLNPVSLDSLYRYLRDWPKGRHIVEANETLDLFDEWDNIKRKGHLIQIMNYYNKHKNSPLASEINRKLLELRERAKEI